MNPVPPSRPSLTQTSTSASNGSPVTFDLDEPTLRRIRALARSEGVPFETAVRRMIAAGLPDLEREVLGEGFSQPSIP